MFFGSLKYLKTSRQQPFETPGNEILSFINLPRPTQLVSPLSQRKWWRTCERNSGSDPESWTVPRLVPSHTYFLKPTPFGNDINLETTPFGNDIQVHSYFWRGFKPRTSMFGFTKRPLGFFSFFWWNFLSKSVLVWLKLKGS